MKKRSLPSSSSAAAPAKKNKRRNVVAEPNTSTFAYVYPVSNLNGCANVTGNESSSIPAGGTVPAAATATGITPRFSHLNAAAVFQSSDYGEGRALQATPFDYLEKQLHANKTQLDNLFTTAAAAKKKSADEEGDIDVMEPIQFLSDSSAWDAYLNTKTLMLIRREFHRIRAFTYRLNAKDRRREMVETAEIENDDWHEDTDVDYLLNPSSTIPYTFGSHMMLREICFTIPTILDERHWMRHHLSWSDVLMLLNACPKADIWRKTLFDGSSLLGSASKTSWISSTSMIIGGKRNAIKKQEAEMEEKWPHWSRRASGLLKMATIYKNPIFLPFRYVPAHVIETCRKHVPQPHTSEMWLGQPIRVYQSCMFWKGNPRFIRHYVPLAVYENVHQHYDFVLLNRVLPYPLYQQLHSAPNCVAEWPDIVRIHNNIWALADEAMWLWSETSIVL